METAVWLYQHYCAKHPRLTEVVLACVALLAVHVGLSYLKQAAQQTSRGGSTAIFEHQDSAHPSQPASNATINNAKTTGDSSPAIAGNGNVIQTEPGAKK